MTTRPDIATAVGELAKFSENPGSEHWIAAKRVLRYLKGTAWFGIEFRRDCELQLIGFADADYAGDLDTRRSTTGYVFMYGGGPVSWNSKRQSTVALSTMEAEYMALCAAVQEGVWLEAQVAQVAQNAFRRDPMLLPWVRHESRDFSHCRRDVAMLAYRSAPTRL